MKENPLARWEPLLKGATGLLGIEGADQAAPNLGGSLGMLLDAATNPALMQAINTGLDLLMKLVIVGTTIYGILRRKKILVKEVAPSETAPPAPAS